MIDETYIEALRVIAESAGYKLVKKPDYDCYCYHKYGTKPKCANYVPLPRTEHQRASQHCKRKETT